jgi:hypothetical protein
MSCQKFVLTYLQQGFLAAHSEWPGVQLLLRDRQFARDILGPAEAEGPVAGAVFDVADKDVLARNANSGRLLL